jgi:UDP-glucose 4-epimerase
MAKRALVTGIAGFIGSNLASDLLRSGWQVVGVDDMSAGRWEFVPKSILPHGMIEDDFASKTVLDRVVAHEFDVVFHLAAQPRVSYSVEHPLETHNTNVTKTLKLIDACRGKIERFVFASSSAVYGDSDVIPTVETVDKKPTSPYALHKSIVEDYLKLYGYLYNFDSVAFRFFNVYGPNQLGNSPYSTAVSAWLTAIKEGRPMRSDGDGTQTRDMVHVADVTRALKLGATYVANLGGEVFNVGTGKAYMNNEILKKLRMRYPDATVVRAPARPGDVKHTLASVGKLTSLLSWKPSIDFWDGLEFTAKWYDENWEKLK